VITHGEQVLEHEDADIATELERILRGEGIDILLAADVVRVEGRSGESVRLRVRAAGGGQTNPASSIPAPARTTPTTPRIGAARARGGQRAVGAPRAARLGERSGAAGAPPRVGVGASAPEPPFPPATPGALPTPAGHPGRAGPAAPGSPSPPAACSPPRRWPA